MIANGFNKWNVDATVLPNSLWKFSKVYRLPHPLNPPNTIPRRQQRFDCTS